MQLWAVYVFSKLNLRHRITLCAPSIIYLNATISSILSHASTYLKHNTTLTRHIGPLHIYKSTRADLIAYTTAAGTNLARPLRSPPLTSLRLPAAHTGRHPP